VAFTSGTRSSNPACSSGESCELDLGEGDFAYEIAAAPPYRRIEDAHYARNAEIKASAQGRAPSAIVCQTLDEFIANSTGYEMLAAA
jgi:hypothetical protein